MVRRNNLDGSVQDLAAEIFNGHLGGDHSARTFQRFVNAGHVTEHPDFDFVI